MDQPAHGAKPMFALRWASLEDVPGIARVDVASWRQAYRGQIPSHVLDALDEVRRRAAWHRAITAPAHGVHVVVTGGAVVGYSHLAPSRDADAPEATGEVTALYVDPEQWGCGTGRALLEASLAEACRRGYRVLTLWVLASNVAARRFYERLGLVLDGASKDVMIGGVALLEVRYRLELGRAGGSV